MNNEYKKDEENNDILVLNYDGSTSADIKVTDNDIVIFEHDYDGSNYNHIPIEDWEEFKDFVESKIYVCRRLE